jgi:hypothetical protein
MDTSQEISRVRVLNNIYNQFQNSTQWYPSNLAHVNEKLVKAEALIELLEEADCGSIGGYDRKNPVRNETKFKLLDRFLALIRKYDDEENLDESSGLDLYQIKKFYTTLTKLRENSIK